MKVVHVPFSFFPDPAGGTEVYVDALARSQQNDGTDAIVAAPGTVAASYRHGPLQVRRFPVSERPADVAELYGGGDAAAARAFGRLLDAEAPDIVHLHAFTRGVSLGLVREAKRRGIAVVFSYHTPTVSCQRGTLLRWGSEVCSGALDVRRCSQCVLQSRGMGQAASRALGLLPAGVGRLVGSMGLSGPLLTALRMTSLMELRHRSFHALMREADHVVALSEWVRTLLVGNGVDARKITVSRQGLGELSLPADRVRGADARERKPLRIMCAGRLDPTKGMHLLVDALRRAPELPATLDIYGIAQGEAGARYRARLEALASGDGRVSLKAALPADGVVARMTEYDIVAVPSQWLETGPMVVMEAFAAGVPVVGSRLGGIAELVTDGTDGLLVDPLSIEAWRAALIRLCGDPALVESLRSRIRPPRRIADVRADMSRVYATAAAPRAAA